ncbi:MAG: alpha/beta hydrolase [Christensenellaceae bacterium]|nr:alpha/beta hydrolase [Christensenellaceae bacterium]
MAEFIYDNQSIHYEIAGVEEFKLKTPVLLLHGNGEDMHIFDEMIAPLLSSRGFILMDSRTQGESHALTGGSEQLSYSIMADDAIALMNYLDIGEYDIVGYSDGGIIALIMAMRTYNVRRLITIGVNTDPSGLTSKAVREIRAEQRRAGRAKDPHKAELMRLMLEEPHITLHDLAGVIAETTIVLGRKDGLIDHKHSEKIADAIPRASHKYIENAGHDIPRTHAGVLSDMIRTLL